MAITVPGSDLQDLKDTFRKAKAGRDRLEPEWFLCVAFYFGEQWLWWNKGRLDRPNLEDWRVTLVDNRILPAVSSRVARKLKNRPNFTVTPNSMDEADLDASELAELVLDNDWLALNLSTKLLQAQMWQEICGAGFWKIYWDKNKGDSSDYLFNGDGQPQLNADNRPIPASTVGDNIPNGMTTQAIAQGDCVIDAMSPFELFPDPLATQLDECEYIIEEKVRSKEYVQTKFNYDAREDAEAPVGIIESRLLGPTMVGNTQARGVTVKEMWMRPSSKERKGKWVAWVEDKILVEKTLDQAPFEGCPYVMFRGPEVPGRFWPTSITSQLRGPNTELNKVKSQISENASRIGNPALLRARTANIEYSGVPGEDVLYDDTTPNSTPTYLFAPEIPGYVREQIDRIEASITEISGIHEISKATVPSGVTAASAINLLQEADDTRLGPEIANMEGCIGEAGSKVLKLRAKYQSDQRFLRTAGEDGEWNIQEFKATIFKNNTNAEVQAGSQMPRSKAAKQAAMQEVFNLVMQYGVQVDQRDLRKFFKDYEVGGLEKLFTEIEGDELQVKRENNQLWNGTAVNINDFDDDDFHIAAHNEKRKMRQYLLLDDPTRQIIDTHVNAHMERRKQLVDTQLAATGVPQPPPGQPPVGGPPTNAGQ